MFSFCLCFGGVKFFVIFGWCFGFEDWLFDVVEGEGEFSVCLLALDFFGWEDGVVGVAFADFAGLVGPAFCGGVFEQVDGEAAVGGDDFAGVHGAVSAGDGSVL